MKSNFIILVCIALPFLALAQNDTASQKLVDTTIKTAVDTTARAESNKHGFSFGIKFGLNYNKISGLELTEGYKPGFHFGIFGDIGKGTIGLQPELLLSQAGTKISNDSASEFDAGERVKLTYLQIPLLLRVHLSVLTLHIGPQFGFLLNQNDLISKDGEQAFKAGDFAMDFGAQLNIGNLKIYGRYCIGLNDISDLENQESWKNEVLQIGLGIKVF